MFQTVYLCLVTGRMYFYLSPPTSHLNHIILILLYFHFLKLNWGCTIINNKLIESNDLQKTKTVHIANLHLIGKETQDQDTFAVFVMCTTKIALSILLLLSKVW